MVYKYAENGQIDKITCFVSPDEDSKAWFMLQEHNYCKLPERTQIEPQLDNQIVNVVVKEENEEKTKSPPPSSKKEQKYLVLKQPSNLLREELSNKKIKRLKSAKETFDVTTPRKGKKKSKQKKNPVISPRINVRKDLCETVQSEEKEQIAVTNEIPRLKVRQDLQDFQEPSLLSKMFDLTNPTIEDTNPINTVQLAGDVDISNLNNGIEPLSSISDKVKRQLEEYQKKFGKINIFLCDKCDYRTEYEEALKQHLNTHGNKPLKCDQCPYMTFLQIQLLCHINSKHAINQTKKVRPKRANNDQQVLGESSRRENRKKWVVDSFKKICVNKIAV